MTVQQHRKSAHSHQTSPVEAIKEGTRRHRAFPTSPSNPVIQRSTAAQAQVQAFCYALQTVPISLRFHLRIGWFPFARPSLQLERQSRSKSEVLSFVFCFLLMPRLYFYEEARFSSPLVLPFLYSTYFPAVRTCSPRARYQTHWLAIMPTTMMINTNCSFS